MELFFKRRSFSGPELRSKKLMDFLLPELCDKGVNDVTQGWVVSENFPLVAGVRFCWLSACVYSVYLSMFLLLITLILPGISCFLWFRCKLTIGSAGLCWAAWGCNACGGMGDGERGWLEPPKPHVPGGVTAERAWERIRQILWIGKMTDLRMPKQNCKPGKRKTSFCL